MASTSGEGGAANGCQFIRHLHKSNSFSIFVSAKCRRAGSMTCCCRTQRLRHPWVQPPLVGCLQRTCGRVRHRPHTSSSQGRLSSCSSCTFGGHQHLVCCGTRNNTDNAGGPSGGLDRLPRRGLTRGRSIGLYYFHFFGFPSSTSGQQDSRNSTATERRPRRRN